MPPMTSFLLARVRAGGGLISAVPAGARTAVARRLGGGLIICCDTLPAPGGAVCGVPGSRPPTRCLEGVQSRVLWEAAGGSSARGSSDTLSPPPAHACRTVDRKNWSQQKAETGDAIIAVLIGKPGGTCMMMRLVIAAGPRPAQSHSHGPGAAAGVGRMPAASELCPRVAWGLPGPWAY